MSQRNPMNDRYQTDEHRGQTRKSAAAMKPKAKAAASVRMQPKEKTKQQKKAEQKAARAKQAERDRQYSNPPTPEYKRLRKLWWVLLIVALAATFISFSLRDVIPEVASYTIIAMAYACIIAALYLDWGKMRKMRNEYRAEMEGRKSKERRAIEKQQKAAQRAQQDADAANKEGADQADGEQGGADKASAKNRFFKIAKK